MNILIIGFLLAKLGTLPLALIGLGVRLIGTIGIVLFW